MYIEVVLQTGKVELGGAAGGRIEVMEETHGEVVQPLKIGINREGNGRVRNKGVVLSRNVQGGPGKLDTPVDGDARLPLHRRHAPHLPQEPLP